MLMVPRAVATAVLASVLGLALAPAPPAAAEQTAAQQLFRKRLLSDRGVSREVKRVLRSGGFVDRRIRFGDVTGDGKSDALVLVNEGGTAGQIALYLYSSHGGSSDGAQQGSLRLAYKHQGLYRARASLKRAGRDRPQGAVVFRTPVYDPGDILADPGAWKQTEVRWSVRRRRLRRVSTEILDNVDTRHCSRTGDFCTRTFKTVRGATYLELRTLSFRGRYTLCVTTPAKHTDCRAFTLRRNGDEWISRVRWAANFPDEGRGRYSATWQLGADRLGPSLGFRRP
jgi:hypothetical protein